MIISLYKRKLKKIENKAQESLEKILKKATQGKDPSPAMLDGTIYKGISFKFQLFMKVKKTKKTAFMEKGYLKQSNQFMLEISKGTTKMDLVQKLSKVFCKVFLMIIDGIIYEGEYQ